MSTEVVCGKCQGRLLIETPGVVVACPHCGTHLSIPATEPTTTENQPVPAEIPESEAEIPASEDVRSESSPGDSAAAQDVPPQDVPPVVETTQNASSRHSGTAVFERESFEREAIGNPTSTGGAPPVLAENLPPDTAATEDASASENSPDQTTDTDAEASEPPAAESAFAFSAIHDEDEDEPFRVPAHVSNDVVSDALAGNEEASTEPSVSFDQIPLETEDTVAVPPTLSDDSMTESTNAVGTAGAVGEAMTGTTETETPPPTIEETATVGVSTSSDASSAAASVETKPAASTVSKLLFIVLLSYASAVTIGFGFLYLRLRNQEANPHELESLPDIKPPMKKDGTIGVRLIEEGAEMAPGHTLRLGESQRYGSLKVTPLRVTREPIQFVHHLGDPNRKKPSVGPVLKLWLRFENVSDDQVFAPLDADLLFRSFESRQQTGIFRSNTFLCRKSDKAAKKQKVLVYQHPLTSSFNLVGLPLDRELKPGEVLETYIPSTQEGIDELSGDLVWRVHFRKGYNPESFRGVTTLIEVEFHSDEIQEEAPPATEEPAQKTDKKKVA